MVEADRADGREGAQIVLVRRVIAVPGDDVDRRMGELRLEQTIYVDRDSQKKLVLGHKGRTIAHVGKTAREEIQDLFGETVHLFLYVKVREGWADDKERLRNMGLEV